MKFPQFKNKRVLIVGLGVLGGGVGAARFFFKAGAEVLVTDLKKRSELKKSIENLRNCKIKYVLGEHRDKDFKNADLIIKGPSVRKDSRYLKIAKENKVEIDTDIGIFFKYCPCEIIGITGTKGKSTISTLVYELLKSKHKKTFLGGNIQKSVLEILPKLDKDSLTVLELSSWQLEGLTKHKKSPHVALITNIFPDHLNTYKNFAAYRGAKEIIFKYQTSKDILVLNRDDKELRNLLRSEPRGNIKSRIKIYSLNTVLSKSRACVRSGTVFYKGKAVCAVNKLNIQGDHNLRHILGAITAVDSYKISAKSIRKTVLDFKGVFGRLEFIKKTKGIKYFNDTAATNPNSVIVALNTLGRVSKNIVLIAGGVDKEFGSDIYSDLAKRINCFVKHLVFLPGTATDKIKRAIKSLKANIPFTEIKSMKEAVLEAERNASGGDIVILSPGGSSFNLFKNEFDRGEQFIKVVKKL